MAMESAFVHTRVLCEFLLLEEVWAKDGGRAPHTPPALPLWAQYRRPMHMKVLHPDPTRPYVAEQQPGDDLKDRVFDLAAEVLKGWDLVARQPPMALFRSAMIRARNGAVADGAATAGRLHERPVFK